MTELAALLVIAERILNEASNVRRLADLFTNDTSGVLTIAMTHTRHVIACLRSLKLSRTFPGLS